MPQIQLQKLTVGFGGPPVLDEVDLVIERGERLALVGRNGAGKSTLLQVLRGKLEPDDGRILADGSLTVAALGQYVPEGIQGTVLDLVLSVDGASEHEAEAAISRVGLDAYAEVSDLSAGLKRRALLARALVIDPDVLLLDEPTNHLDIDSIQWLEDFLRRQNRTLLFVTHDRAFLRNLATGIIDLDRGRVTRHDGDYDTYLERKEHGFAVEARSNKQSDKRLAQEEVWIRRGVRARTKRNQGRVRSLMEMRTDRADRRDRSGTVKMEASSAAPSGRLVIRTKDMTFNWPDQPVVSGLSTEIMRGDRIGIIGPNGTGKTTLIRLLLGELAPQEGTVQLGTSLEIAYFDQLHATLDDTLSAADNVSDGSKSLMVNGKERSVISYLGDFLFTADQARGGIQHFSGGERNRLLLARLFCRPSNMLVLDEPTNDLDIETLEVLEELLYEYDGTILVVSHDRELLDHVVTSTIVLEGDGRVAAYVGGYSDWLHQRRDKPKKRKKTKTPKPTQTTKAVALTSPEKQELRSLPALIEKLETTQAKLHAKMADPAFFKGPGDQIAKAKQRLAELESQLASTYARWEALEAKQAGS